MSGRGLLGQREPWSNIAQPWSSGQSILTRLYTRSLSVWLRYLHSTLRETCVCVCVWVFVCLCVCVPLCVCVTLCFLEGREFSYRFSPALLCLLSLNNVKHRSQCPLHLRWGPCAPGLQDHYMPTSGRGLRRLERPQARLQGWVTA